MKLKLINNFSVKLNPENVIPFYERLDSLKSKQDELEPEIKELLDYLYINNGDSWDKDLDYSVVKSIAYEVFKFIEGDEAHKSKNFSNYYKNSFEEYYNTDPHLYITIPYIINHIIKASSYKENSLRFRVSVVSFISQIFNDYLKTRYAKILKLEQSVNDESIILKTCEFALSYFDYLEGNSKNYRNEIVNMIYFILNTQFPDATPYSLEHVAGITAYYIGIMEENHDMYPSKEKLQNVIKTARNIINKSKNHGITELIPNFLSEVIPERFLST